jgi:osmotically-inducible protein OsmY
MTRPNERDYDERYEDDQGSRMGERAQQYRDQSDAGQYRRRAGEPHQFGGRDNERFGRPEQGGLYDRERGYPQASERGYDRGTYSQPSYAQRNYDESSFQRAGYDRNRDARYGQRDFDRVEWQGRPGYLPSYGQTYAGQSNYSPNDYGSNYDSRGRGGYDPSPRYGESVRSDWSSVNDPRGAWSRPASGDWGSSGARRGGFIGKGPKGYTRSDDRIREDVCDRLSADDELDASDITVTVSTGEVTLEGTVPDRRSKHRAEDLADSVAGVLDVHNRLRAQKGLVQEVSDKLLGREEPQSGHHAGSGTRNTPAGTSATSGRVGAGGSSTNENLNHR